ncbi:MAG: hypothetical protein IJ685_01520 [Selenomonadaceae bacterium]|nr:hypothetical protein [Selenomonadaceae bacterium]
MRQIFFAVTFAVTLIFAEICAAQDVWVAHWQSENIDVYAMDDTITSGTSDTGKYFSVSTKFVSNGQLQQVVVWKFSKFRDDMWRYETSTMDGSHTTVVIPRNGVFEFCMDRIGWSYKIVDMWYY